jgi:hypothetical protein
MMTNFYQVIPPLPALPVLLEMTWYVNPTTNMTACHHDGPQIKKINTD